MMAISVVNTWGLYELGTDGSISRDVSLDSSGLKQNEGELSHQGGDEQRR